MTPAHYRPKKQNKPLNGCLPYSRVLRGVYAFLMKYFFRLLFAFLISATLAGCATTPLGVVANADAERKLGEQSTPTFLASNGGIYENAAIQAYLDTIVARLSAKAAIPAGFGPIRIGILDTDTPSAYTVPGGGIYLSRGMIAMANDEAELASVIAHEIGHVTARHVAERVAAAERLVLDVVRKEGRSITGTYNKRVAVLTELVSERLGELSSFSEEQELEADRFSLNLMQQAGYDPNGMGRILSRLDQWQRWRVQRIGLDAARIDELNKESGYPATATRIAALGAAAPGAPEPAGQAQLMAVIDGMAAEDVYQGGIIRNGRYRNAAQGVAFDIPDTFLPLHGEQTRLVAETAQIWFQFFEVGDVSLDAAQDRFQERGILLEGLQRSTVNGLPALMGKSASKTLPKEIDTQVVLVDLGQTYLMLMLIAPKDGIDSVMQVFDRMTASIRKDSGTDTAARRSYRTRRVTAGESVATIVHDAAFGDDAQRRLRLLNGLEPGREPSAGSWIKVIQ